MRRVISIIIFLMLLIPTRGISQNIYWVGFPDKKNNSFSTQSPETFLSPKAIQRRLNQQIEITEEDLPVSQPYLDSIIQSGTEIIFPLKWLNGVVVRPTLDQLAVIQKIEIPFTIISIYEPTLLPSNTSLSGANELNNSAKKEVQQSFYGNGYEAINSVKGTFLHQKGYKGGGMLIAIIDDGFFHANQHEVFAEAFSDNRIVATKDFVNPTSNIFEEHSHGTHVFSIVGANAPSVMVGMAPEANFILLRSENIGIEQLIEEYSWSAAAEFADSLGVDIINTSLGYTTFDISTQNHSYSDLTGDTTPISKSCSIAAKKGIIVVCSAGNEGNKTWRYISAPADAKGIISVGAVTADSIPVGFSSIGPSADGRVKPEVVALGSSVGIVNDDGTPAQGNGTSYAAPIITGMAACLWQAFHELNAHQIREAIITSASGYSNPTERMGYGIPNAQLAYVKLLEATGNAQCIQPELSPNPFDEEVKITVYNPTAPNATIAIYTSSGICIYRKQWPVSSALSTKVALPSDLPKGMYIVNITCGACLWKEKLVKQ